MKDTNHQHAYVKLPIRPWIVPGFVLLDLSPQLRQDGWKPDSGHQLKIEDLDPETLADQCDKFRKEVFHKAGKVDPLTNCKGC